MLLIIDHKNLGLFHIWKCDKNSDEEQKETVVEKYAKRRKYETTIIFHHNLKFKEDQKIFFLSLSCPK